VVARAGARVRLSALRVAVRAWGYPNGTAAGFEYGPASEPSDPIRFASPLADVYPVLDCASCRSFEVRDPNGDVIGSYPHPSSGSWELVDLASFVKGYSQVLLRERTTGALWIGNVTGGMLTPYASQLRTGFDQFRALTADFDGDGVAEIALQNQATGRVEVWAVQNGAIVQRLQWNGPLGWRLIGVGDFDGDRQADLWFDAGGGIVLVARFRFYTFMGSIVMAASVGDSTAVAVADYDGDWIADLLFRDAAGVMQIAFTDPSTSSQTLLPLASQTGDQNVVPVASVDIDHDGGAEVLLQNQVTGSTSVALPLDRVPGRRIGLVAQPDSSRRLVDVE
jgi:hypothetical protein